MGVTFSVEPFPAVYPELMPLLAEHYAEISLHAARGYELRPQVRVYLQRHQAGELLMMIGRDRGKIVAYSVIFVAPGLHYADCLTAIGDIFYVERTRRGALLGPALFSAVEQELRRRGVNLWTAGEKVKFPCEALMRRAGMELAERTWFKWL